MSKHDSFQNLHEVFFALCKDIGTPRSLGMWLRFKYRSFDDIATVSINPRDYLDPHAYIKDYVVVEYLSKNQVLPTTFSKGARALQKFNKSEELCRQTNARFRKLLPDEMSAFSTIMSMAARKIAYILGPLNIGAAMSGCRWGPGSTYDIPLRRAGCDNKFETVPTVTWGAVPYLRAHLELAPAWFYALTHLKPEGPYSVLDSCWKVVPGNKVVMVSKDAKADRPIAQEPTANSFMQQGVGRYIRSRLKRHGVNLDSQEINRVLASLAYDFDLATVDLSSASDTIARGVVYHLLPLDWAEFLDALRSKKYQLERGGPWIEYEKFSSMGNAFTFELESLIFYALNWAVTQVIDPSQQWCVSVYGDDIICPQNAYHLLKDVLTWCGFVINDEKSYHDGMFFESCGRHFFGGKNVRPVYQKRDLSGPEVVRAHNRLYRLSSDHRDLGDGGWLLPAMHALQRVAGKLYTRTKIPYWSEADDGFLCAEGWSKNFSLNYGWRCTVYRHTQKRVDCLPHGHLAACLHRLESQPPLVGGLFPNPVIAHGDGKKDEGGLGRPRLAKRWIHPI